MRILITGSRDWTDEKQICQVLNGFRDHDPKNPVKNVLVSGACPTGADAMAERYAKEVGWDIERHPVTRDEWKLRGKSAGPTRNAKMASLGADICVAFIKNRSRGSTNTAAEATARNIPTEIYRE